jgi:CxxC motif-containing protein
MAEETVICIGCPLGCRVRVVLDRRGRVAGMRGAQCRQGEKYVLKELKEPVRTLTTTLRTTDPEFPLLPVRTSRPVLKTLLLDIMKETAGVVLKPPVRCGQVVVPDVAGSGADLVATADWGRRGRGQTRE